MATKDTPKRDINWLVDQVSAKAKLDVSPANIRAAIRSLVKSGEIEDPKNEGRYEFKGVTDPTVKAIIAKLKELAAKATEKPAPKKETAAPAKKAPAKKAPAKRAAKKAEPVVEEDDEDDIIEDDDLDLD